MSGSALSPWARATNPHNTSKVNDNNFQTKFDLIQFQKIISCNLNLNSLWARATNQDNTSNVNVDDFEAV